MIVAYTDGSSAKNRSGWGFVILNDGEIVHKASEQCAKDCTNQQMELMAAANACDYIMNNLSTENGVVIYSDSAYLINCYKDGWYKNWRNNGWINSKREPVANKELWELLLPFFDNDDFSFEKVKGHSGHIYNEMADQLACGHTSQINTNLTKEKNYDTIIIELSEILINYSMKKTTVKDTINKILDILKERGL